MRKKQQGWMGLVGILAMVLLAGACHEKQIAAPATPAPPPPTPPAPTVTLTAEPATIEKGHAVTLSWTSQNATDLNVQPELGKVQAQGSTSITPQTSTTYTITATGPGGTQNSTARVTVTFPATQQPHAPSPTGVREENLFDQNVKDVFFNVDQADITSSADQALTADANFFKMHPGLKFTVEGYCDERGSEEYNLGLGDRRATEAKRFLVNSGVSADRITTISFGKDRSFCREHTEACWQENRRDHFRLGS